VRFCLAARRCAASYSSAEHPLLLCSARTLEIVWARESAAWLASRPSNDLLRLKRARINLEQERALANDSASLKLTLFKITETRGGLQTVLTASSLPVNSSSHELRHATCARSPVPPWGLDWAHWRICEQALIAVALKKPLFSNALPDCCFLSFT